ncbi:MAG: transporter [Clostridia bacterium]|nr:transporter [Clostridia bacterium]
MAYDREHDISYLETYDIETGERKLLHTYDFLIEAPNWSHDGKFMTFNSKGKIYKYIIETDETVEVKSGNIVHCNNDHVLSPDGKSIAVSDNTHPDEKWGFSSYVHIVPFDGGEPKQVTPNSPSFLHGWSPDGETLVYCAFRDMENGADIYAINVNGGEETRLTDAKGLNDGPEFSPDGKHIWFNSVRTGLMQAWRMNADGSGQTQMTFDEGWNTWFPHISPDNKKVAMICYKAGDLEPGEHLPHKNVELRTMNADGSDVKTVVKLFGGQGTMNVNSWSPCSKKFAFVSYRINEEFVTED